MMQIQQLHHVAIICSDYERSKAFYTEVLPFEIIAETYRAERNSYKLDLTVPGGTQIELFSFPDPPMRPTRPEAMGLRHIAFLVKDLDAEITHLLAKGISVEPVRIDPMTTQRFTFFSDPDGLPIELYESLRPAD